MKRYKYLEVRRPFGARPSSPTSLLPIKFPRSKISIDMTLGRIADDDSKHIKISKEIVQEFIKLNVVDELNDVLRRIGDPDISFIGLCLYADDNYSFGLMGFFYIDTDSRFYFSLKNQITGKLEEETLYDLMEGFKGVVKLVWNDIQDW